MSIFPLVSPIFLKRSLVFPILLFSSSSLHYSLKKAFLSLLAVLWNSAFSWVYHPFLLCLLRLFFSQLFVRPPQTTTLSSCVCFSWGWFWSLPLVQCYKPLSIVLQALCHSMDLVCWSIEHSKSKGHGILSYHFMANRWRKSGNSIRFHFLSFQNHYRWWLQPWN